MKSAATFALVLCAGLAGCAKNHPPSQLVDARMTYQQANGVSGAKLAAGALYDARQALDAAEQAYSQEGPNSNRTRNLAYIAHRKALVAIAQAEMLEAQEEKRVALAELERFRMTQALEMRRQLERAKGMLTQARERAEAERQARVQAEAKIHETLGRIDGVVASESEHGLVLTLPNGLLFANGKSQLTAEAKKRLGEIVDVLKDDPRMLTVSAHSDAQGSKDATMTLSKARANAVRAFLVSEGIDDKRILAEGKGDTLPVADNKSAEGRTANRRVEIILERRPTAAPPATVPSPGPSHPRATPPTRRPKSQQPHAK